jgi:galactose mutarotase-like enzyme
MGMNNAALLSIAGPRLSATVSTLGAELQTLVDARGRDLLWDGDPAFWTGRAPLLFPVVGRLVADTYRIGGREHTLPQHGFARRREFEVVDVRPHAVTLALSDDAETRAAYPFAFWLEVTHEIRDGRLDTTAVLANRGEEPLPAAFGFHPAFRWPLPGAGPRASHEIVFEVDEPAPIHRPCPGGLIDPSPRPSPVSSRRLPLSDDLLREGALVFTELRSRRLRYGCGDHWLAIDFPDSPHLGIWTLPGAGAGYVCIEPWQGHADVQGFAGEIWDKPGIAVVQPGESRTWRMGVEPVT